MNCPHEKTSLRLNGPHVERYCLVCDAHLGFVPKTHTFESASTYRMPWGKYKGEPIERVPRSYLEWAAKEFKETPVKRAINVFLRGPNAE